MERKMTTDELRGLTVDGVKGVNLVKSKRNLNARDKFEIELHKNEKLAHKKRLPFARHAARDDFNQTIESQVKSQLKQYGSIEKPEELKLPNIDWSKYSDLKNFKVIGEHERADNNLSRQNPGLSVQVKVITYKFNGYGQTYKIMESGPDAITRAIKNRAKLDKSISKEL